MPRADLTITTSSSGVVRLRADEIRRSTLVQLAAAYLEDPTGVIDVLGALAEVVRSPRDGEGAEIDAAVGDVEDVAGMGPAEMELRRADLGQLANEITKAYRATGRSAGSALAVRVPAQRGERGAA